MTAAVDAGFRSIGCWHCVTPFAGRVVAYNTSSPYLGLEKGFTIKGHRFGYIERSPVQWNDGETGYNMRRLLTPKGYPSNCALVESALKLPVFMRLATNKEIGLIGKAINAKRARFEYMSDEIEIRQIFERHVSKHQ